MKPGSSGSEPKIRIDKTHILISPLSPGLIREELVIMNEGKGRLYGSIRSDAPWVTVLDTNLNTTFIQRIILEIRPELAKSGGDTWVHILSTGGIARVRIEIQRSPVPVSTLQMDERVFQFCGITKDETISFSLTVRNTGAGFLSGTAVPLCDWIEIPTRGIWTRSVQVIPVKIFTAKAPPARHPVGRIHVRTNGGEEIVEVSIHRSLEKGPVAKFTPSSLRISWSVRGIIEERLVVRNIGAGILRGTIPTKYPWVTAIPSIFSVEDTSVITIRVDTRLLSGTVPASVPLMVITNAGPYTLNLEITRIHQPQGKPRPHIPRIRTRSRMTVLDDHGITLQVISSGKSGGEGEIWYLEGDDSRCVKVFHPHRSSPDMEDKIRVMQKSPLRIPPGTGICWPVGVVTSTTSPSRFLGYLMTRLDDRYVPVHAWYDRPEQDFEFSLKAAGRLAHIVHVVHASGHCVGDLRENNVFISSSGEICLIDTDSFQITDPSSSRTWFCRVGTGEYLPPELIDGSFEKQNIDRLFADRFALAVLIFRFLMQGAHPYQGRGPLIEDAPTTPEKIIRGLFAYEGKIPGLYPPEYAPPYERIPTKIRALFHEAFVTGHQHPQARPEPGRWVEVLGTWKRDPAFVQVPGAQNELDFPPEVIPIKPVPPEFVDEEGVPVRVRDRIVRVHHAEIRSTDRPGYQFLMGSTTLPPLVSCPVHRDMLPPSILLPVMMVFREHGIEKKTGYLIPEIDYSLFVHWHIAADPESRAKWKGKAFSFRHRLAACRNLLSALLSIERADLTPFRLSSRSVFVAPDCSVRIIAIPREQNAPGDFLYFDKIRVLIYTMLMNGFTPDHLLKRRSGLIPGHALSEDVLPLPMRKLFGFNPGISDSFEECLQDWFMRSEQALRSLIPCQFDPDHWYGVFPGFCPFCRPEGAGMLRLVSGPDYFLLSSPMVLFLSAPEHTVRYVKRRRIHRERERIAFILLPFCLTVPLRISGRQIFSLASRTSDTCFLPICRIRSLPVCIPCVSKALVVIPVKRLFHTPFFLMFDLSFIDEMRWVSAHEKMKGEFFPRLIRRRAQRRQYVRKTVSVMLLPGVFYLSENEGSTTDKPMKKGKKRGKKGFLSKKLSDFMNELLG